MSHLSYSVTATLQFHHTSGYQKVLLSFKKYVFKGNNCVAKTENSHFTVKNWKKARKYVECNFGRKKRLASLQNSTHIYSV